MYTSLGIQRCPVMASPAVYPRYVVNYDLAIFSHKIDPLNLESQNQAKTLKLPLRLCRNFFKRIFVSFVIF